MIIRLLRREREIQQGPPRGRLGVDVPDHTVVVYIVLQQGLSLQLEKK
jgi:hypothetical protein